MPDRNIRFNRAKDLLGKHTIGLTRESAAIFYSKKPETVIIGVDPGVTTGVSVIGYSGDPASPSEVPYWGSTQLSYGGSGNHFDEIETHMPEQDVAHRIAGFADTVQSWTSGRVIVAIEDFIIRQMNQSRDFLAPVRVTSGIIQALYERSEHYQIDYVMQSPSDAKSICTNERMDLWGYKVETQRDRHSRDADRHSVLCLRKLMEKPRSYSRIKK